MTSGAEPDSNIAVVGQGYVGLPLALAAAASGCAVVGIETDAAKAQRLQAGTSPTADVADQELAAALSEGRYRAESSFDHLKGADITVLCVPTPYRKQAPDLSHVESAAAETARRLERGALVILESTAYPGTTTEVVLPILEAHSGFTSGTDFDLAFSPERIDPGNPTFGVRNTPKIVGGITARSTVRASAFYSRFVDRVVPVSSPATAEMAKLLENTFRYINIALVNELAIFCRDMSIDVWEVIDAAASKPFGFMPFYPGPGVGGPCIPIDPMYLSWRVRQFGGSAKFIELARAINDTMPLYCASRVQDLLNDRGLALKGSRILIVGVTYKPDVGDIRESPAIPLMSALLDKGALLSFYDPHVDAIDLPHGRRLFRCELSRSLSEGVDCAVIVTPHTVVDHEAIAARALVVLDTRRTIRAGGSNVHLL